MFASGCPDLKSGLIVKMVSPLESFNTHSERQNPFGMSLNESPRLSVMEPPPLQAKYSVASGVGDPFERTTTLGAISPTFLKYRFSSAEEDVNRAVQSSLQLRVPRTESPASIWNSSRPVPLQVSRVDPSSVERVISSHSQFGRAEVKRSTSREYGSTGSWCVFRLIMERFRGG